jgi:hypothetical protein
LTTSRIRCLTQELARRLNEFNAIYLSDPGLVSASLLEELLEGVVRHRLAVGRCYAILLAQ